MAFSLTSTGVSIARGRGKNAVTISLSFAEIEAWAKRMHKDEKELWRLSYGRAAAGLKKRFIEVMRKSGGVYGVPKFKDFDDFTKQLRARSGRSARLGGLLADNGSVVMFKRNGAQVIGWPDHLGNVACAFQEGRGGEQAEKWFTDPEYRQFWHRHGLRDVPRAYVHNERMVIEPYFVEHVREHLDDWAKSAYFVGLAKLMQGKKDRMFERANLA